MQSGRKLSQRLRRGSRIASKSARDEREASFGQSDDGHRLRRLPIVRLAVAMIPVPAEDSTAPCPRTREYWCSFAKAFRGGLFNEDILCFCASWMVGRRRGAGVASPMNLGGAYRDAVGAVWRRLRQRLLRCCRAWRSTRCPWVVCCEAVVRGIWCVLRQYLAR